MLDFYSKCSFARDIQTKEWSQKSKNGVKNQRMEDHNQLICGKRLEQMEIF